MRVRLARGSPPDSKETDSCLRELDHGGDDAWQARSKSVEPVIARKTREGEEERRARKDVGPRRQLVRLKEWRE